MPFIQLLSILINIFFSFPFDRSSSIWLVANKQTWHLSVLCNPIWELSNTRVKLITPWGSTSWGYAYKTIICFERQWKVDIVGGKNSVPSHIEMSLSYRPFFNRFCFTQSVPRKSVRLIELSALDLETLSFERFHRIARSFNIFYPW